MKPLPRDEDRQTRETLAMISRVRPKDPEVSYAEARAYLREQRRKAERPMYEGVPCGVPGDQHRAGGIPSATASGARGAGGAR